jgi:hypothetical protein
MRKLLFLAVSTFGLVLITHARSVPQEPRGTSVDPHIRSTDLHLSARESIATAPSVAGESIAAQRCGVDTQAPSRRFFANPNGKLGWREYRSVREVPELEPGMGQFAALLPGPDGHVLIRLEEPGENFAPYSTYCFDKTGKLVAVSFELQTVWGWGYREEGSVANGSFVRQSSEFFRIGNDEPIVKPERANDVGDALKPRLYAQTSRLPFARLLRQ